MTSKCGVKYETRFNVSELPLPGQNCRRFFDVIVMDAEELGWMILTVGANQ